MSVCFKKILLGLPVLCFLAVNAAGASSCDQPLNEVASQAPGTSEDVKNKVTNADKCRAFTEKFIRAVTARQVASACQESEVRRRALEYLDAEIEKFNDQIAEQSCGG